MIGLLASALLLLSPPAQAEGEPKPAPRSRSVETLTFDDPLPTVVDYRPMSGILLLDGLSVTGHRSDLRTYLEYALPFCEDAALVERRRRARWRAGNAVAFSSIGGLLVLGMVAPDAQIPMIALGGTSALGMGLTLSGASMRRSVKAYNSCSQPLAPPSIPLRPTGFRP